MFSRAIYLLLLSMLAGVIPASAQETRGTISGTVLDDQGTVVPGATITVVNVDTNVSNVLTSNVSGYYEASLLLPGNYRVTAELQGFKTAVRSGIILSVGQQVDVKMSLSIGAISETVVVTGEATMLDTSVVSTGLNLDRRSVESLPMFSNMPVLLTRFVPGVNSSADVPYVAQGFVNRTSSDTSSPGGVGGNEWTIDGATNNGSDRRLASSPNSDMIQEVRIETANFDASFGHSTGLGISMMTRSGTNQMHGSMNYQYWNNQWNAAKYFTKKNYYDNIAQAQARGDVATVQRLSAQPINPLGKSNNLANTFGGPLIKNKLFVFANYSWNHDDRPAVSQHTIPTAENLRGDFSNLLAVDPVQFQIYDPNTTRPDPARPGFFIRDPFPGNIIPQNRIINPLYAAYSKWLPTPNNNPTDSTRQPTNNYQANTYTDPIDSQIYGVRVDFNLSNAHRFFGRWSGSNFTEGLNDWTYQSAPGLHNEDMRRTTNAGTVNWTWIRSATTVVDAQASANTFFEGGDRNTLATFKPSDVGLPTYLDQKCEASNEARLASERGGSCALPIINLAGYQAFGKNAAEGYDTLNLQFTLNMTKIRGEHTMRAGTDVRRHSRSGFNPGASQSSYTFDNTYTRRYSDTALYTAGSLGLSWASFMLGLPTVSTINTPTDYATSSPYYSVFAQDAWRLTQKLTLNVGLRFEFEQGMRETADRMLVGFDPALTPAIKDEAVAAYARSPIPELSVSAFRDNLDGAGVYAGVGGQSRRAWKNQAMWLPRASAAYQVNDRLVVRGGYGIYYDTLNATAIVPNQLGYSTVTSVNSSNDFGQTWISGNPKAGISPLVDPFPLRADGTRFVAPVGNSLGGDFVDGNTLTYGNLNREHARMQRWRLGAQHELGRNMTFEAAYVGSFADHVDVNVRQDVLPEQYWNSTATRNTALATNMNANVANPFYIANFEGLRASNPELYGRLAAQSLFASPTVAKNRLLRPSPFMATLTAAAQPLGEVRTHSVELTFQRRFSQGLSFSLGYVGLLAEEWTTVINEYEQRPTQWVSSNNARPHRVTAGTVWELPFGRGRAFLNDGGMLGKIFGGWQTGQTFEWQPGPLVDFSAQNLFFYGNLEDIPLDDPALDQWFNVNAGFERNSTRVPADFQTRLFPLRVDGVRRDQTMLLNSTISRTFPLQGRTMFQIRLDAQNSLNRQHFANPTINPTSTDFGRVTANANTEQRFLVLIAKLTF
ncbi:MAG: carboxypeptidase-like regulatory domain-containing protein [Vicinamibacterales bacterium]|nr:carboxypeptidase-like regulatory domain-containing protein [Vicinamibacterales bacterium]